MYSYAHMCIHAKTCFSPCSIIADRASCSVKLQRNSICAFNFGVHHVPKWHESSAVPGWWFMSILFAVIKFSLISAISKVDYPLGVLVYARARSIESWRKSKFPSVSLYILTTGVPKLVLCPLYDDNSVCTLRTMKSIKTVLVPPYLGTNSTPSRRSVGTRTAFV